MAAGWQPLNACPNARPEPHAGLFLGQQGPHGLPAQGVDVVAKAAAAAGLAPAAQQRFQGGFKGVELSLIHI